MYKIIYLKADYEPWWQFEGWETLILSTTEYESEDDLNRAVQSILAEFRSRYEYEQCKNERFFAFWSEDECMYCEACDDDAQIFHGIIVEKPIHKKTTIPN